MERRFSYPLVALLAVLFHSVAAASATGTNFSVFDGTVYSYTDGHVRAMRLLTKAELWKSAVPGNSLDTIPVMDSGALVFCAGGAAQRIVSLEVATGKLRWNKDGFCEAVVAHAGNVYILSRLDGSISALDGKTGRTLWRTPGIGLSGSIFARESLVITDRMIVSERTGRVIRRFSAGRKLLAVAKDRMFWESGTEKLICSSYDGEVVWEQRIPAKRIIQVEPFLGGALVVAYNDYPYTATSGILMRLDNSGVPKWKWPIAGTSLPSVSLTNAGVDLYLTTPISETQTVITKLSRDSGGVEGTVGPLTDVIGPVVAVDGKLLIERSDGSIEDIEGHSSHQVD